jgi:sarcosine oxidase
VAAYDVVVVGAGAMGSATARAAAGRGARVALVEQFRPGHDRGSSHGPSRIFRLAYRDADYVPFAQQALRAWRELEAEADTPLLTTTGGIDHGSDAALADVETGLRAAGVPFSRLSSSQARERWPGMRFEGDAVWQPDAGVVNADAAVAAMQQRALHLGAHAFFDEPVVDLRLSGSGVEVLTSERTLVATVAVLAAGAWLPRIVASLPAAAELPPLTVTQEQPAYFPAAPDGWPAFVHHAETPDEGAAHYGLLTPGVGLKVGEHGSGVRVDPDRRPPADDERVRRLSAYVEKWLPGADPAPARVDTCLYTTTPDERFILRRFGAVIVCSACSGHGFKFAPAVGERVARLALHP